MYVAAKGGERAIDAAHDWLARERRGDPSVAAIEVAQIREQLGLAVDRVMAEGALHDPDLAALAIKQARGDLVEAAFLIRAFRASLPRWGASEPVDTGAMACDRRISAAFKDLPGGQVLGPTFDYTHRLLDPALADTSSGGTAGARGEAPLGGRGPGGAMADPPRAAPGGPGEASVGPDVRGGATPARWKAAGPGDASGGSRAGAGARGDASAAMGAGGVAGAPGGADGGEPAPPPGGRRRGGAPGRAGDALPETTGLEARGRAPGAAQDAPPARPRASDAAEREERMRAEARGAAGAGGGAPPRRAAAARSDAAGLGAGARAAPLRRPKVADALGREGLMRTEPEAAPGASPADLTREPLAIPAPRDARLQALARGDEGFLLGLAYSTQRGYGRNHAFVGELRAGACVVEWDAPGIGRVEVGEITLTEVETINQFAAPEGRAPAFTRGYGLAFGRSERRALSMALLDRAMVSEALGEAQGAPAQDQEFVLLHADGIQATGFLEHIKLPHHVDFQAELELLRRLRAEAEAQAAPEAAE